MPPHMINQRVVELLKGASLFSAFAADDLAACAVSFREARFAKGEIIFARGDPGAISISSRRDRFDLPSPPARVAN